MIKLTEIQRTTFKSLLIELRDNITKTVEALELENDSNFAIEFILMSMLGGSAVTRIQLELKLQMQESKKNEENNTNISSINNINI